MERLLKLYLLRPKSHDGTPRIADDSHEFNDPWEPWYDKSFGFVIRAESEVKARELAMSDAGDEVGRYDGDDEPKDTWLNSEYSTCEVLSEFGDEEIIMRDFASA